MADLTEDEADRCESCSAPLRGDVTCRCGPPADGYSEEDVFSTLEGIRFSLHKRVDYLIDRAKANRGAGFHVEQSRVPQAVHNGLTPEVVGYIWREEGLEVSVACSAAEIAEQTAEVWRRHETRQKAKP